MKKQSGKDKFRWMWEKQNQEAEKLYRAKQEGKKRRKAEKQAELDKRNSLYITNLPNNLQNITNKQERN